jgi:hypothetical protein
MFSIFAVLALAGCSDSSSSTSNTNCAEPENPYTEGTAQYDGFKWAAENGDSTCEGNSDDFNEGCREYNSQEEDYEDCAQSR